MTILLTRWCKVVQLHTKTKFLKNQKRNWHLFAEVSQPRKIPFILAWSCCPGLAMNEKKLWTFVDSAFKQCLTSFGNDSVVTLDRSRSVKRHMFCIYNDRQCQASKKINEAILFSFPFTSTSTLLTIKTLVNVSADEMNVINHLTYMSRELLFCVSLAWYV